MYKRITLDEGIKLSDLTKHSGISSFTKPFMKDRLKIFKRNSSTLLQMKVNKKKDYIEFIFLSVPTYNPEGAKITQPKSMKLVPHNEYDQTIRILDFFKLLKSETGAEDLKTVSKNDIMETLSKVEIQMHCDCPMYWWQGNSYYLTQEYDGAIIPNNIIPTHWNLYHKPGEGLICKHLDLIFSRMSQHSKNFTVMIYKYIQKG